jgi:hypothetical protein
MRRVILESPYAGAVELNERYARACLRHSLGLGEAPLASHLLYTQPGVLNDQVPEERTTGIYAGHAWTPYASAVVVYTDLGISNGMTKGINQGVNLGIPIEYRKLEGEWK